MMLRSLIDNGWISHILQICLLISSIIEFEFVIEVCINN
ncbi:unnamed protein product [Arabidopsis halleri]